MSLKKRVLAFICAIVLCIGIMPAFAFAAGGEIAVTYQPSVFDVGQCYNIVWVTDANAVAYVEYQYEGVSYRVYDQQSGIVRTDDNIHVVSVQKEHLDNNTYTAYATKVESVSAYGIEYGQTVSCEPIYFKGYHGQEQFNIFSLSDIHADTEVVERTAAMLEGEPDILVLLGDINSYLQTESDFTNYVLDAAHRISGGSIPILYTRGNHETRGAYAPYIIPYFRSYTGQMYFKTDYGPISIAVLDTGEDKVDTHVEYSGLVDYASYRAEENEWLENEFEHTEGAKYKLAFAHINSIFDHFGYNWYQTLVEKGTQLITCGHIHQARMLTSEYNSLIDSIPIFSDGGRINSQSYNAGQILIDGDILHMKTIRTDGTVEVDSSLNISTGELVDNLEAGTQAATLKGVGSESTDIFEMESAQINEGAENQSAVSIASENILASVEGSAVLKGADLSSRLYFTVKPTVFDSGDEYIVVWATNLSGTGKVRYTYEGKEYVKNDTGLGVLRSGEYLHRVRVPKAHLDGNSYEVITQNVPYHGPYTATKGDTISSGAIEFAGYSGQESITVDYISSLDGSAAAAASAADRIGQKPDVLVLGGDLAPQLESYSDVVNYILKPAAEVTGGQRPVVFVRGKNECKGAFAARLCEYLSPQSYSFYGEISYGPLDILVLDNSVTEADGYGEYQGLNMFDSVRSAQLKALSEMDAFDGQYRMVFAANGEFSDETKAQLTRLGSALAVAGRGQFGLAAGGAEEFALYTNGGAWTDGVLFTRFELTGGKIAISAYGDGAEAVFEAEVDGITGETDSAGAPGIVGEGESAENDEDIEKAEWTNPFNDVKESDWFYDAVRYCNTEKILSGTGDDSFTPQASTTRAMFVMALAQLMKADLDSYSGKAEFDDVRPGAWYAEAVAWAVDEGIAAGVDENSFMPDAPVTREQAAAFIHRLPRYKDASASSEQFTDADEISDWAYESVQVMRQSGVISGMGDGSFAPKALLNRAQLAVIFMQVHKG